MLQTEQPSGIPTRPHILNTLTRHSSGLSDSEVHCTTMGTSPTSSSNSPICSESPTTAGGSFPSAKHSKKKARNRPPKHIRKGTVITRRPGDADSAPVQQDSGEELSPSEKAGPVDPVDQPATDRQVASSPLSRLMSAPINVPSRHVAVPRDPGSLKIEAFSSPKWLGTGFSDQMESRLHVGAGPRCSGPMIDTSRCQFTYFANSMW